MMPTYDKSAFVTVQAHTTEEAEALFQEISGNTFPNGVGLSLDDGPAEVVDDYDDLDD
jgi:hypothetical protein